MSKVFNVVGGGGGKNISSIIITGLESTDTIDCTKDGKSYTATWDSTAQHWEIVGLPLGTFTVTATNGTKTTTETVLIDITGVYEIEMDYKLWLYRDGDECEEVTGGWSQNTNWIHGSYTFSGSKTLIKNDDNLYLPSVSADASNATAANKINFSNYNTLYIELENVGNGSDSSPYLLIADSVGQVNQFADMVTSTRNVYTVDVTSISGMKVLAFECISGRSVKIYKVWLK